MSGFGEMVLMWNPCDVPNQKSSFRQTIPTIYTVNRFCSRTRQTLILLSLTPHFHRRPAGLLETDYLCWLFWSASGLKIQFKTAQFTRRSSRTPLIYATLVWYLGRRISRVADGGCSAHTALNPHLQLLWKNRCSSPTQASKFGYFLLLFLPLPHIPFPSDIPSSASWQQGKLVGSSVYMRLCPRVRSCKSAEIR